MDPHQKEKTGRPQESPEEKDDRDGDELVSHWLPHDPTMIWSDPIDSNVIVDA